MGENAEKTSSLVRRSAMLRGTALLAVLLLSAARFSRAPHLVDDVLGLVGALAATINLGTAWEASAMLAAACMLVVALRRLGDARGVVLHRRALLHLFHHAAVVPGVVIGMGVPVHVDIGMLLVIVSQATPLPLRLLRARFMGSTTARRSFLIYYICMRLLLPLAFLSTMPRTSREAQLLALLLLTIILVNAQWAFALTAIMWRRSGAAEGRRKDERGD